MQRNKRSKSNKNLLSKDFDLVDLERRKKSKKRKRRESED